MVIKKSISYKVLLALSVFLALVFYDISLPLINTIILLKLNLLGFFLEPLLQWAFAISLRQAQIIAAWIYVLSASVIAWFVLRRIYLLLVMWLYQAHQSWSGKNRTQKFRFFLLMLLACVLMAKTVFLLV